VASDGNGAVTFTLDTSGGTSFGGGTRLTLINPVFPASGTGVYFFNFTVPSVTCTGANGMCTLQATSSPNSNWWSCSSIAIVTSAGSSTGGSQPTGTVVAASTLIKTPGVNFCHSTLLLYSEYGVVVSLPNGQTAAGIDATANSTYMQNVNNPNVFLDGSNPTCIIEYPQFLCTIMFVPVGLSQGSCQSICFNTMAACSLNPGESLLYNCGTYPEACLELGNGAGGLVPTAAASLLLALVALFGLWMQ